MHVNVFMDARAAQAEAGRKKVDRTHEKKKHVLEVKQTCVSLRDVTAPHPRLYRKFVVLQLEEFKRKKAAALAAKQRGVSPAKITPQQQHPSASATSEGALPSSSHPALHGTPATARSQPETPPSVSSQVAWTGTLQSPRVSGPGFVNEEPLGSSANQPQGGSPKAVSTDSAARVNRVSPSISAEVSSMPPSMAEQKRPFADNGHSVDLAVLKAKVRHLTARLNW